jgi:hypothetical protein
VIHRERHALVSASLIAWRLCWTACGAVHGLAAEVISLLPPDVCREGAILSLHRLRDSGRLRAAARRLTSIKAACQRTGVACARPVYTSRLGLVAPALRILLTVAGSILNVSVLVAYACCSPPADQPTSNESLLTLRRQQHVWCQRLRIHSPIDCERNLSPLLLAGRVGRLLSQLGQLSRWWDLAHLLPPQNGSSWARRFGNHRHYLHPDRKVASLHPAPGQQQQRWPSRCAPAWGCPWLVRARASVIEARKDCYEHAGAAIGVSLVRALADRTAAVHSPSLTITISCCCFLHSQPPAPVRWWCVLRRPPPPRPPRRRSAPSAAPRWAML